MKKQDLYFSSCSKVNRLHHLVKLLMHEFIHIVVTCLSCWPPAEHEMVQGYQLRRYICIPISTLGAFLESLPLPRMKIQANRAFLILLTL